MSDLNFKDFLIDGGFLQISPNLFKLIQGPFQPVGLEQLHSLGANTLIYRSNFWDFLDNKPAQVQKNLYLGTKSVLIDRVEFIRQLQNILPNKPDLSWTHADDNSFRQQFDWTQNRIRQGFIQKSVSIISQKAKGAISLQHRAFMLMQLLQVESYGWRYGFFSQQENFMGLTPEVLLLWNLETQHAETTALAGTFSKTSENFKLIMQDQKTLVEHQFVVEDIQKKLPFAQKQDLKVLELKHLLHLKTDFNLKLQNHSEALSAVEKLHPTAAMGVYPSSAEALSELAAFDLQKRRGAFAAPFGMLDLKQIQIVVGIRNIMFNSEGAEIFSGCGVTSDSIFESELFELENKRNSVKKMLGLIHE